MILTSLCRVQGKIARRQKALWITAAPLTAFATLIAVISPASPGTGGIEDIAFAGKVIAIFTGIAYSAAFAEFFTAQSRLGMGELESTTPVRATGLKLARLAGTFGVVIAPSLAILLTMGIVQTGRGQWLSMAGAAAVTATITAPSALIAITLSGVLGTIMPPSIARIVAVLAWFYLVFATPLIPLPTLNGSVLNIVGDTVGKGFFHTSPIYEASGTLEAGNVVLMAVLSLLWQASIIAALLWSGTKLGERTRRR